MCFFRGCYGANVSPKVEIWLTLLLFFFLKYLDKFSFMMNKRGVWSSTLEPCINCALSLSNELNSWEQSFVVIISVE